MLLVIDKLIMFQLEWWQEKWTWNDDIFKINSNFQTLEWPFICTISKLSHDKQTLSILFIYGKKKRIFKSLYNKLKAVQVSMDSEAGYHSSLSNRRPSQASSLVLIFCLKFLRKFIYWMASLTTSIISCQINISNCSFSLECKCCLTNMLLLIFP